MVCKRVACVSVRQYSGYNLGSAHYPEHNEHCLDNDIIRQDYDAYIGAVLEEGGMIPEYHAPFRRHTAIL